MQAEQRRARTHFLEPSVEAFPVQPLAELPRQGATGKPRLPLDRFVHTIQQRRVETLAADHHGDSSLPPPRPSVQQNSRGTLSAPSGRGAWVRIPRSPTSRLEAMNQAARIPQGFKAFRDKNKPIRERFESIEWFMGSLHLPSHAHWDHEPPSSRASVLDCASPLALLDPPDLRKPKRQRTGAGQDLAALRRFMERENATNGNQGSTPCPRLPRKLATNRKERSFAECRVTGDVGRIVGSAPASWSAGRSPALDGKAYDGSKCRRVRATQPFAGYPKRRFAAHSKTPRATTSAARTFAGGSASL